MKFAIAALIGALAVSAAVPTPKQASRLLNTLPLRFEANAGQFPAEVRFGARFGEHPVFLTAEGAVVPAAHGSLKIRAAGGRTTSPKGTGELKAKSAYFTGKREMKPGQFGKVRYEAVYPGIDMVFHGDGKRLEYDFAVAPGADPKQIQVEFAGADLVAIQPDGSLRIEAVGSTFDQPVPVIYQDGENGRTLVAGGYRAAGKNRVAFHLGAYDRTRALVIDPVIVQGTYIGGESSDVVTAVTIDTRGRIWVAGYTTSGSFPASGGPFRETRAGNKDAFVAVFTTTLAGPDSLIYTTYLGGIGEDEARAIAVDAAGTAHVAGFTSSDDFPSRNGYQDMRSGEKDAFLSQINITERGDASLWFSTVYGGPRDDIANGVTIDALGNVYIAGYTNSVQFPLLGLSLQPSLRGGFDAFVVQFTPALLGKDAGIYSTFLGGGSTDVATGITAVAPGIVVVSGYTMSGDFPINDAPLQPVYKGRGDMFITRLDLGRPRLDALGYSTFLGGSDLDQPWNMVSDSAGRVYLVGTTLSTDFPLSANAYQTQNRGEADAVVVRLDLSQPRGQELTYSTYLGSGSTDGGFGVAVDTQGRILVAGYTFSEDFPIRNVDPANVQVSLGGGYDAFAAVLDPAAPTGGETLACSTYLGGEGNETAYGVASDPVGNTFVVGTTTSRRLGIPEVAPQKDSNGFLDGFIARLGPCRR